MKLIYEIVYYRDIKENSPIEEFLRDLPDKDRAKVFAHIQMLKEKGFLPFPYTTDIKGAKKLRELRIRFSFMFYRIIYFMFTGKKIIILHGFSKTSKKIPPYEIEIAQKRMNDFLRRENEKGDRQEKN